MAIGRAWAIGQTILIGPMILIACGATTPPPLGDDSVYLRAGVDPSAEATALERNYVGFRRTVRIDAPSYSAFSMDEPDGNRSLVRVVTSRGVALAVDAPEEHGRSRVGLVDVAEPDLDGDGLDELLVFAFDPARDRQCIAVVRVQDGRSRELPIDLEPLGGDACIERVEDVGGDRRPEAIAVVRFPELSSGTPPRVEVPFGGADWRRVRAPEFFQSQRDARREATSPETTPETAYRRAVELAALAHFDPRPGVSPAAEFERALQAWEAPDAEMRRQRAHAVFEAWNDEAQ